MIYNIMRFDFKMLVLIVFLLYVGSIRAQHSGKLSPEDTLRIHERTLTIDTHSDTPMHILYRSFDIGKRQAKGKVDLPRMKEGGLDAMFFAAYVQQLSRTEENYQQSWSLASEMLDSAMVAVERNNHLAEIALCADDALKIKNKGKRAIYLCVENGFAIGKDLKRIRELHDKGVRYITLCHSRNNDICDSSTDKSGAEHNGLSSFGREVVREMNRLGMMVDVSHVSDKSFFDVLEVSSAPVIASHSSVRAIARHERNMTDEMIKVLAKNGGVIQICILTNYLLGREESRRENSRKQAVVQDIVDHIDHVVKLAGVDYVGIGSDFDGGGGISGCMDVSEFPNITRELLRRGYSEEDIQKIWGGNVLRVFREVERTGGK